MRSVDSEGFVYPLEPQGRAQTAFKFETGWRGSKAFS